MATITLGSMFSSGGKTIVSGGSTNLDTEALVQSLADAKRLPAVQLEKNIEKNATKVDALGTMKTLLEKLQTSANFLRNVPGLSNFDQNVFSYSTAKIKSNTAVEGSTYFTATIAPGTLPANYTLTVDQLATRQTYVTNTISVADANTSVVDGGGAFNSGVMKLGPSETEITLAAGDSLNEIAAKINAAKGDSGVEATVVKVSNGNYRLVLKSTDTGAAQNFDFNTLNPTTLNVGFASQTNAVNALVTIDGTQVSRSSNTITDLVDGATLNLLQQTPVATSLTLEVRQDTSLAKDAIMNFVDAYNNFRAFAAQQNATDDSGALLSTAVLSSDPSLRTLTNSLGSQVSSIISGLSGTINSLAAVGITLTDYMGDEETPLTRNILKVDEAKLDAALSGNFDDVRKVFEFSYTSDSTEFIVFRHAKNINVTDIQFNIDKANGIYTATFNTGTGTQTINLTATDLGTGGGVSLKADADSPLAGLEVIFGSDATTVVNMSLSQGIGDKFYNTLTDALDSTNGIVAQQIESLKSRTTRMEEDIVRIDEIVEKFRESLLKKFSALEAAISSVNNILNLLQAQADARNNA